MGASKTEQLADVFGRTGLLPLLGRLRPGRLVVLCYHRIRPDDDGVTTAFDPGVFGPTVSEFEKQVAWLSDNVRVLDEEHLVELARSSAPPSEPCVAITFDDGYRDNFTLARPILERAGVPATFFIPTTIIERRELGWWDIVAYLVKHTSRSTIAFAGRTFDVGQERERLVAILQRRMVKEHAARVPGRLSELSTACGVPMPDRSLQDAQLMTWEHVRETARGGVIAIGSHAQTHQALSMMPIEAQRRELTESKRILEQAIGRTVRTLAYPFGGVGHFTRETERLAQECGYDLAFSFDTNLRGYNRAGSIRPYCVNRIEVPTSPQMLRATTVVPEVFARNQVGPSTFVVLGSSPTALALGRRIREVGGVGIHVDTEAAPGDIATRSRAWAEKHRGARGPEALRLLLRLGAERDGLTKPFLIGTGDEDLLFIAEHRAELDVRFDVLHPSNDAMITCLDKARFQRFCDAHGVPVPAWFVCRADPDEVRRIVRPTSLPLVARLASPSRGRSRFPKMLRLDTAADIEALVRMLPGALGPDDELIFSESLLGRDLVRYSVAFCRSRHACLMFEAVKERPSAASGDVGTYVTLTDAPEARAMTLRAAEALDYYGMGEIEIFRDRSSDRYYAIEINARPWLQLGMESIAGTDFLGFLAGHSSGIDGVARPGAAWVDLAGDLYWRHSRSARRSGAASQDPDYLKSLTRVRAFKFFTPTDPGPAVVEAARWLRRTFGPRG